jgi:hypothetical protein
MSTFEFCCIGDICICVVVQEISGKYYFGGRGLTCQSSQISYNRNLAKELWEASAAVSERVMSQYGAN